LVILVTALPGNTPAGGSVFVAGNFQDWEPGQAAYRLQEDNTSGVMYLKVSPTPGILRFKFTRGSWQMVESRENGGYMPDREHVYTGGQDTLRCRILGWEDLSDRRDSGTAGPGVSLLREDFHIPQLDCYRRVWVYVPPDYHRSSKRYPVIYLQDGQNLFDKSRSFSGEWEVDESLDALFSCGDHGYLVVGVENGGDHRLDEYAPWYNPTYQRGGAGAAYADFLANTLKPYVDANFRTLPDKDHTAIVGSSLGALIAHYTFAQYPAVFGRLGAFSPAYWFNPEIFDHIRRQPPIPPNARALLLGGIPEGGGRMQEDVSRMYEAMLKAGYPAEMVDRRLHSDGQHQEWYWAREFPGAIEWLFRDFPGSFTHPNRQAAPSAPYVYTDPTHRRLFISEVPSSWFRPLYRLTDPAGRLYRKGRLEEASLDISKLRPGRYLLRIGRSMHTRWQMPFEVR
jgi:metallo-beta-lactamase class B